MLDNEALKRSSVVANNRMNRERACTGGNSYARELKFDILDFVRTRLQGQEQVRWLDLCCGAGRALIEAARILASEAGEQQLLIIGIDLVSMFDPVPANLDFLKLTEASISDYFPGQPFDLITCVHGLHYVGDKLGVIARACSWIKSDGIFTANLDPNNIKDPEGKPFTRNLLKTLRTFGLAILGPTIKPDQITQVNQR